MEQEVESNSVKKVKAVASTAHTLPIFQNFILKKEKIPRENLANLDSHI